MRPSKKDTRQDVSHGIWFYVIWHLTYPILSSFVLIFWELRWLFAASSKASRCLELDCLLFVNKHVSDLLFKDWLDRNCLGKSLLIKAMTLEEIYVKVCVIPPSVHLVFSNIICHRKYNTKWKQKKIISESSETARLNRRVFFFLKRSKQTNALPATGPSGTV